MDLSDVPTFAYDESARFANNTVYFLSGEADILFLLGYLNSRMAAYLFSQIGSTSGVGTTRWQAFTMERLPVPVASPDSQSRISRLAFQILVAKAAVAGRPPYHGGASENGTAKGDAVRRADIGALEAEIDELAFDLYGLTPDEREAVRNATK